MKITKRCIAANYKEKGNVIHYPLDVSDAYIGFMVALHKWSKLDKKNYTSTTTEEDIKAASKAWNTEVLAAAAACSSNELQEIAELVSEKQMGKYYGFGPYDVTTAALHSFNNHLDKMLKRVEKIRASEIKKERA